MSTENNHEDNSLHLRIARGAALVAIGSALMSRLPQLLPGQQETTWLKSPFTITGMVFTFLGLLILFVPPSLWRNIVRLFRSLPYNVRLAYIRIRWGPIYSFEKLNVRREITGDEAKYTANMTIIVDNRDIYPLEVSLDSAKLFLKQKVGWRKLLPFGLLNRNPLGVIELPPKERREFHVTVSAGYRGNSKEWPNPQNLCKWKMEGIYAYLRGKYIRFQKAGAGMWE